MRGRMLRIVFTVGIACETIGVPAFERPAAPGDATARATNRIEYRESRGTALVTWVLLGPIGLTELRRSVQLAPARNSLRGR